MRLPNGYGSVYKLSGNRRNPWIARKTIGWDENGKQLYQTIGYYEKRDIALQALANYNKDPYDVEVSTITFSDVYLAWSEDKFKEVGKSSRNGYNASYLTCSALHDIRFVDIKTKHMQDIMNSCNKGKGSLRKLKVLFNQLFAYAMANDIVRKDYSDYVEIPKIKETNSREPFTLKEINRLFEIQNEEGFEIVDSILMMIYTGLRIGELLIIKNKDIDLDNKIIVGGIKTDAGKDRVIPISAKIFDLVENRVNQNNKYFISRSDGKKYTYDNYYRDNFIPIMNKLGMNHKPHDCRHTFATLMSNAGADTIALQKIMGHADYATTANIYTHKDIEELKKAISLL